MLLVELRAQGIDLVARDDDVRDVAFLEAGVRPGDRRRPHAVDGHHEGFTGLGQRGDHRTRHVRADLDAE